MIFLEVCNIILNFDTQFQDVEIEEKVDVSI